VSESSGAAPSYWDYLRVEDLLSLQGGLGDDDGQLSDHELLFVIVHQVYELWFKLVLRELATARDVMNRDPVPDQDLSTACASLHRIVTILDVAARHFAVVETLTTRDFLDFREKLLPASGFQSAQLRELEILLGLQEKDRLHLGWEGSYLDMLKSHDGSESPALARVLARREDRPTFRETLDAWLWRTPIRGSTPDNDGDAATVRAFVDDFLVAQATELAGGEERALQQARSASERERLQGRYAAEKQSAGDFLHAADVAEPDRERRARIRAAVLFIETYRELPLLAWPRELLDGVVSLEQTFVVFRQRHARMVERVIGRRTGTGGSAGVEYLDQTALEYRIFRDVWAIRTVLVRGAAAPPLEDEAFYGFRFQD